MSTRVLPLESQKIAPSPLKKGIKIHLKDLKRRGIHLAPYVVGGS